MLSCFLFRFFSLKIGTFHLLSGQPGQGLKIGIVPGKSGHLAGLMFEYRFSVQLSLKIDLKIFALTISTPPVCQSFFLIEKYNAYWKH